MTDRELDALVAEHVMGWLPPGSDSYNKAAEAQPRMKSFSGFWASSTALHAEVPAFSTSIADAWEVVEKVSAFDEDREHPWLCFVIAHAQPGQVGCRVIPCPPGHSIWCEGERPIAESVAGSAPRAICLAALRAVGVEVPDA